MIIQRINITLPDNLIQELSFTIPAGKRSKFIADAVSEKLNKQTTAKNKLKKSLIMNKSFYAKIGKDWEYTEVQDWPQE